MAAPRLSTDLQPHPAECGHADNLPDCSRRLNAVECRATLEREATFAELDTGRYRLRYLTWGVGPRFVLIPGLCSPMRCFAQLISRLRSTYCCITFELPDGVRDGARLSAYQHADFVTDLHALLDHLAVPRCVVLGASFGGTIALAALAHAPARFTHVILEGGFARRQLSRAEVFLASLARYWPGRLRHLPGARRILWERAGKDFAEREAGAWELARADHLDTPLKAAAHRAMILHRLDLRAVLPRIQAPVLLVQGDRDPLINAASHAELRAGLPRAACAVLENCGHLPHLTHPEVMAEALRTFLAGSTP